MKRIKVILLLLGMLIIDVSTIKAIETTTIRYGGKESDYFNEVILDDNNLIAVGYSKSKNIDGINNNGGNDGIIVKYDQNDNMIWQNNYGTENDDEFKSIISVDDGYIVVGLKNGKVSVDNEDATGVILKYDKDGNLLKELEYKIKEGTKFVDIEKEKNGDYIILGDTYQAEDSTPLIVKYDKNNEKIFEKELTEYESYKVKKILNLGNDGYIILLTNGSDSVILRLDLSGEEKWSSTYTMKSPEHPVFEDVILTSNKTYVVVGGNDSSGTAGGSTSQDLAFMLEYDLSGNLIDEKIFKNYKQSRFVGIVEIENRYVVLAQLANLERMDITALYSEEFDVKILKFDYNKILRDEISTGVKTTYAFYHESFSLTKFADNDYFIVLSTTGNLLDSEPKGNLDAVILKTKNVFGIEPELPLDVDEFKEVEVPNTSFNITAVIIIGILLVIIGCLSYIIISRKKYKNKKSE